MTQAQLVTLADQHTAAHQSSGQPQPHAQSGSFGPGLMAMAAMQ